MIKLRVIAVVFLIISIVFLGFNLFSKFRPNKVKVILIGIDGATWDVILPLVNQGKMPNFEKLMQEGSWGYLKTIKPGVSPVIWTSIATGKRPDKHGILDFVVGLPGSYKTVPVTSNLRKSKALWNMLSGHDKKTCIVGWCVTWPAEEINGFMISDRFNYNPKNKTMTRRTYPEKLINEIKKLRIHRSDVFLELESLNFPTEDSCREDRYPCFSTPLQDFSQSYQQDQTFADTGLYLLSKYQWDLISIYLKGIDWISHRYWKYMEPQYFEIPEEEIEKYKDAIKNYYIYTDGIIENFLQFADRDTVVIIVSDHGFEANVSDRADEEYRPLSFNRLMEVLGLLKYKHNVLPLHWRGLADGKFIDWERTKAYEYATPGWGFDRKIRLNLKGREPEGIIDPGEYEQTEEKVKQLVSNIVIKETNKPFLKVKPCFDTSCDFIVSFNVDKEDIEKRHITYLNQTNSLPIRRLFLYNHLSGDHSDAPDGILVMRGKSIQTGKIEVASIFDITPTILYLMGLPVGEDMDGKVLTSAIIPKFIKENPVRYVDTYDIEKGEERKPLVSPVDEEIKEQLRSLGYLQ